MAEEGINRYVGVVWSHAVDSTTLKDFDLDPSQNLLAALNQSIDRFCLGIYNTRSAHLQCLSYDRRLIIAPQGPLETQTKHCLSKLRPYCLGSRDLPKWGCVIRCHDGCWLLLVPANRRVIMTSVSTEMLVYIGWRVMGCPIHPSGLSPLKAGTSSGSLWRNDSASQDTNGVKRQRHLYNVLRSSEVLTTLTPSPVLSSTLITKWVIAVMNHEELLLRHPCPIYGCIEGPVGPWYILAVPGTSMAPRKPNVRGTQVLGSVASDPRRGMFGGIKASNVELDHCPLLFNAATSATAGTRRAGRLYVLPSSLSCPD
ncbi:uncharacterized protein EDB91DRAFT_1085812 [Suillus paluster]|uniref:uncharacterized protein n=1 Tax=Suillus paluster TaxID=48578 RepID=UPI001B88705B|nr:uncharacterized protein EDB91DRAFT_1085812 [Suillus paluster]KAG1729200.1 hypothetical protein EDB91DRAFT_1085812 [Suillus paluster]